MSNRGPGFLCITNLEQLVKNFLAVYIGTPEALAKASWESMSEEHRRAAQRSGMEAWTQWMERNKDSVVDGGAPLGRTKRVSDEGIEDIRNELVAYVIVRAESHEAAARLFERHPHFTVFPGDSVQIMECLPMPKM